jgi:hypothetical protein
MKRTWGIVTALRIVTALGILAGAASLNSRADDGDGFATLFNGKDLSGWKTLVAGKADSGKTFFVRDGVIVVSGSPAGYFYTDKSFKNYVLRFDWRYKRPADLTDEEKFGGNSGLLVHIQLPHRVWPKCVEVQGENRTHGNIFAIEGAKGKFTFDRKALKKVRNPVGDWNTTEVICRDGAITSKVNGTQVSTGKGDLTEGPFGFQSEGAELHFKNIKIKTLP